jgi:hypothetical protein
VSLVVILEFNSHQADDDEAHSLAARRVANHVALAPSHERLAEERTRAAALREREKNLGERRWHPALEQRRHCLDSVESRSHGNRSATVVC